MIGNNLIKFEIQQSNNQKSKYTVKEMILKTIDTEVASNTHTVGMNKVTINTKDLLVVGLHYGLVLVIDYDSLNIISD